MLARTKTFLAETYWLCVINSCAKAHAKATEMKAVFGELRMVQNRILDRACLPTVIVWLARTVVERPSAPRLHLDRARLAGRNGA